MSDWTIVGFFVTAVAIVWILRNRTFRFRGPFMGLEVERDELESDDEKPGDMPTPEK